MADAGISTASITAAFRLGFIPLYSGRYDLVILKEYLEQFTSTAVYRYLGTSASAIAILCRHLVMWLID